MGEHRARLEILRRLLAEHTPLATALRLTGLSVSQVRAAGLLD